MLTAQTKHAPALRYRAYAVTTLTRKPTAEDHIALANAGKKFAPGQRVGYRGEDVAFEGDVVEGTGGASGVSFDAGKTVVTRVALYAGPVEEEVCVGSVEVNASGSIGIAIEHVADETDGLETVEGDVVVIEEATGSTDR